MSALLALFLAALPPASAGEPATVCRREIVPVLAGPVILLTQRVVCESGIRYPGAPS